MKLLSIILLSLLIMGCASEPSEIEFRPSDVKNVCIDNVTYILFTYQRTVSHKGYGFMTVKLNEKSQIIPCN